jgi:hydroxymethylbilane synthase
VIAAVPERAPANDALIIADCESGISNLGSGICALPPGARVGTSSVRRAAQLRRLRPDLVLADIRGNVDTRLRKLREGQFDAIIVAFAGMFRLGLQSQVTEVLPFDVMLPAPGQGALAVETRAADARVVELAARIADAAATAATTAERALLQALGGGCYLPLGAYAEAAGPGHLRLRAILLSPDGARAVEAERTGPAADPVALAHATAADIRAAGAP